MSSVLLWNFTKPRKVTNISGQSVPTLTVKLSKKNFSWTAWLFKMGPKRCPKMSVTNYHSTLHKIPEEHQSCPLHTCRCFSLLWRTQCVTGNENDINRTYVSFSKGQSWVILATRRRNTINISHPANSLHPTDENTKCVPVRQRPKPTMHITHFTLPDNENLTAKCFTQCDH